MFDKEFQFRFDKVVSELKEKLIIKETKELEKVLKCSCGAKHTSNPNYHLDYCDFYKFIKLRSK
jgi:hypothetical protein